MSLSALLITGLALANAPAPEPLAGAADQGAETTEAMVCVIAPRVEASASAPQGHGVVMAQPTLVVSDRLRAVIVERVGQPRLLLQSSAGVLPVVIPWQGSALQAGEAVTLRLRPLDSSEGTEATLRLMAAASPVLADYRRQKQRLGTRASAWIAAIDMALDQGDADRAWALLFDPEAPPAPMLEQLRQQVIAQGCGQAPSGTSER